MIKHSGQNSVTVMGKGNGLIDSSTWNSLPGGRLKELVNGTYPTIEDLVEAAALRGVMVSIFGPKGVATPYWSLHTDSTVRLVVPCEPTVSWAVRVACSYSPGD
jgi:hypothetical protein